MPKIILYGNGLCPPARFVRMVANAIGVDYDLKNTYHLAGDCKTPEYLKINPMHTIPTIVDNGFALSESNAISVYLVDKYAKNDSLYPKDLHKRALVNERLFYNSALYSRIFAVVEVELLQGRKAPEATWERLIDGFETVERFLQQHKWLAGDTVTLADYAYLTTLTLPLEVLKSDKLDLSKYSNIMKWLTEAEASVPKVKKYQEIFKKSLKIFEEGGKY